MWACRMAYLSCSSGPAGMALSRSMPQEDSPTHNGQDWLADIHTTLTSISVPKTQIGDVVDSFEELRRVAVSLDAVDRGLLMRGGVDTSFLDATKLQFENTISALVEMVRAENFATLLESTLHNSSAHSGAGTQLAWWSLAGPFPSTSRSRELALYLSSRLAHDPGSASLLRSPRASIRAVRVNFLAHTPMWVYEEISAAVLENKTRLHRYTELSDAYTGLDQPAGEYLAALWSSERANRYNDLEVAVRAAQRLSHGSRYNSRASRPTGV